MPKLKQGADYAKARSRVGKDADPELIEEITRLSEIIRENRVLSKFKKSPPYEMMKNVLVYKASEAMALSLDGDTSSLETVRANIELLQFIEASDSQIEINTMILDNMIDEEVDISKTKQSSGKSYSEV